jgi:hypothetical protein
LEKCARKKLGKGLADNLARMNLDCMYFLLQHAVDISSLSVKGLEYTGNAWILLNYKNPVLCEVEFL